MTDFTTQGGGALPATRRRFAVADLAVLSYGFRPFFLMASAIAVINMVLWVGALSGLWQVGGPEGPILWHAHEMLLGYTAAALAGFVLTAVPNWTGRLPVRGVPLLLLAGLWLLGRVAMAVPEGMPLSLRLVVDGAFLPVLAVVVAREVVAGHNAQNLRVAVGIGGLAAANMWFHAAVLAGGDAMLPLRLTLAILVVLVTHIGGRIVPSFTRNVLARRAGPLPRQRGVIDNVSLLLGALALLAWVGLPDNVGTAALALAAALAHGTRLWGWRGWTAADDHLLAVLHVAYGFVPLGLVAVAAAALGWWSAASATHVLTVGAVGLMTLAVMARASRGHTGRRLTSSGWTSSSFAAIALAALARPLAEMLPDHYHLILMISAVAWIFGFGAFAIEHWPVWTQRSLRQN